MTSGVSIRSPKITRSPADSRTSDRSGAGARAGSRIRYDATADTTYDAASTMIANGALSTCTRNPAMDGPTVEARLRFSRAALFAA